jgi:undecaprenyl-diphosphatase
MFSSIDTQILQWLHLNRFEALDGFLQFVSASTTFVSIGLILTVLFFSNWKRLDFMKAIRLTIVLITAALVSYGLKSLIYRERPYDVDTAIEKLSTGGNSSFPSGHSIEAFAIATALSLIFRRKIVSIPVFLWAILVAYSRMALGVHYPTDILAGILIGILIGIGWNWLFERIFNRPYTQT